MESMYGVGSNLSTVFGDPVAPLGPDLETQDEWVRLRASSAGAGAAARH